MFFVCWWAPLQAQDAKPLVPGAGTVPVEFRDVKSRIYDGIIELPPVEQRNGYAVMMIGGGLGSDMDWEVPAFYSMNGTPHHDATTLAAEFLGRGFVVFRWTSFYRDDPKRAADPLMADVGTFPETVEHARQAMQLLKQSGHVKPERIFLVGHSLGARRAAALLAENPQLPGFVSLAGASPLKCKTERVIQLVEQANDRFAELDVDKNGKLQGKEFEESGMERDHWPPDRYGYTKDLLNRHRQQWLVEQDRDQFQLPYARTVLQMTRTPTLLLGGGLDTRWYAEQFAMASLFEPRDDWLQARFFPTLGHQLGPERAEPVMHPRHGQIGNAKLGPIDRAVVELIGEWLQDQIRD